MRNPGPDPANPAQTQLSLFDAAPPAAAPAAAPLAPQAAGSTPTRGPDAAARPPGMPQVPSPASTRFQHPRAQRQIDLGEHRVGYEFRRARRRSIGFVVGAEGLSVSAPRWVGVGEVENALRAKAGWILRKLHEQHERAQRVAASRVVWRDGATLPFLGETVIVVLDARVTGAQLRTADDTLPGVPRLTLHVGLPQSASENQVAEAVQSWLQRQARRVFEERCNHFAPLLRVRIKRLALSSASTRWGSASADGSVRLNWRLIHFALPVIDYVVTHELAHLREMNHSPAFWEVVRSVLPDYERHRGALRSDLLPSFD
ncbi:M48 family metallopeptidase [Aquabacterium sp. OR-4]|uniref:M48 family metallopeptidase n=1 Tax=Aquabacterium sp. OR-4 TaxID=2978127 RepID=UPI0021B19028|nr:SprT family zinc-dependent metalloprotease [Aquabacterium sp. OR-4]MDT7834321.1 SprT family zinc-dependent metalloprotease [Aquabacterium sp. OR-4]